MEAYRFKNLVYIPTPKHASSSYKHLFNIALGWKRTETYYIDWDKDTVFSHLTNPITRYIRGSVQMLEKHKLSHIVDSPDFAKLIGSSYCFDQHTYPLSCMFPLELCYKIEWLLLDHHTISGELFTQAFLKSHDIDITCQMVPRFQVSTGAKKTMFSKIKNLVETDERINSLIFVLQEDLNLYNQVDIHTHFYDLNTKPWKEISYLTNYVDRHGYNNLKSSRFNLQL